MAFPPTPIHIELTDEERNELERMARGQVETIIPLLLENLHTGVSGRSSPFRLSGLHSGLHRRDGADGHVVVQRDIMPNRHSSRVWCLGC
jgi:hypothetical protein